MATLVALAVVVALSASGGLDALERRAVDGRFDVRGSARPAGVTVVAIDDRTVAGLGRQWPYDRRVYARAVQRLRAAGAKRIVIDLQFVGSTRGDVALLEALGRKRDAVVATSHVDRRGRVDVLGGTEVLRDFGVAAGDARLVADDDGILRRMPRRRTPLRTLAEVASGRSAPADAYVDFAGPTGTVRTLSFIDVLRGRARPPRGDVVVLGPTAPILQDLHRSPFDDAPMPGPEIQANAVSTLLRGAPLRDAPGVWKPLLIVLLGLVPGATAALVRRRAWPFALLLAGGSFLVVAQLAFNAGSVLPVAAPMVALVLAGVATLAAELAIAGREQQRLRRMFAQHVPSLVEDVLAGEVDGLGATDVLEGYRFDEVLARGGMGVVYRAEQLELGRTVAIKLLRPEFAGTPDLRERFAREARLAATVEHPNIVPVYAAGVTNGLAYVVMRLVDGVTLEDLLRVAAPLERADVGAIVTQVATALDAAHAAGIVHRDVKPANVLITPESHVYLGDFGIASLMGDGPALTRPGSIIGTPRYMAPEQVCGDDVDARCDVYALGCVAFEMLTGAPPFTGSDASVLAAHASPAPPVLSLEDPGLSDVIAAALRKDPDGRPASAGAFAAALAEALGRDSQRPRVARFALAGPDAATRPG